ncbi:MAG: AAA-like domain-containing protein [Blautia sp.]|nr:AAA-like domain-containing protein [Blautia sp.]
MARQRRFNTTGVCIPELHYMVDIRRPINEIMENYIETGSYFTMNRARQFGKTTTLEQLSAKLKQNYVVIYISFESADDCFVSLCAFAQGFVNKATAALESDHIPKEAADIWKEAIPDKLPFDFLNRKIARFCKACDREVVLIIDEVDKSTDNQIFLSFLGLLREKYLASMAGRDKTFHSVILAGVYDVKNLKLKLRPGEEAKYNSPWNIAADFTVDMSFSPKDIAGMLTDYENDHHTGMSIETLSELIFSYTKGYPYLISYICKTVDEVITGSDGFTDKKAAWTRRGILEAVKLLVKGPNTLYDDMVKHVKEYPELHEMLSNILFSGQEYAYHIYDEPVSIGQMFGFITNRNEIVAVANRIFETQLYDLFLNEEIRKNRHERESLPDKNQFIADGLLDMDLVMEKFYEYYMELYSNEDEKFLERQGRKIFLMYLRPIINGSGNYYVEDQSRTKVRSDIVIDHKGIQYVIECKIWRGNAYNQRGEQQLQEYLDAYHLEKGYLLSFNFNKNKITGIKRLECQGKQLLEVVV